MTNQDDHSIFYELPKLLGIPPSCVYVHICGYALTLGRNKLNYCAQSRVLFSLVFYSDVQEDDQYLYHSFLTVAFIIPVMTVWGELFLLTLVYEHWLPKNQLFHFLPYLNIYGKYIGMHL